MITKDIARALMAGPKTPHALAEELDLTVEEVLWACRSMRKVSKVHSKKPFFILTDIGREWVEYFDSGRGYLHRAESQRLRRVREAMQKGQPVKAVAIAVKDEPEPILRPVSVPLVERAKQSMHPLQKAWGGAWFADREAA